MVEGGQKSIYRLSLQSWKKVQAVLARLLERRGEVAALNLPLTEVFYQYVTALSVRANEPDDGSPLFTIDREIIRLLEVDMVEEFLRDPTDDIIRDNLSIELRLLACAINSAQGITPYTLDEFKAVLLGEVGFYNDSIFLFTLRHAMESAGGQEYASLLVSTLPLANAPLDLEDRYWWDETLLLATSLHLIWRFFPTLGLAKQEALLQHYFYRSLVIGVPVRRWLQEALGVTGEELLAEINKSFIEFLKDSYESVPLNIEATAGKNLADVYREYLPKVYNEGIGILVQEKFITDMYKGSSVGEVCLSWLREALNIFFHLKREDIV